MYLLTADGSVKIPRSMVLDSEDDVINWAYGGGVLDPESCDAITDTSILSVLNEATLEISQKV